MRLSMTVMFACALSFAQLLPDWRKGDNQDIIDKWYNDTNQNFHGVKQVVEEDGRLCQHLRLDSRGEGVGLFRVSADVRPALPKTSYLLEGWVKSDVNWQIFWYEFLQDGPYLTHYPANGGKTGWKRFSHIIETKENSTYFKVSLIVSEAGGKGTWFSDVRMTNLSSAQSMRIPALDSDPKLDADATSQAWSKATETSAFMLLGPELKVPTASTKTRVGIHGKTLHVLMELEEPTMDKLLLDAQNAWGNDTAEIFLESEDKTVFQFGVTPNGKEFHFSFPAESRGYFVDWYSGRRTTGGNYVDWYTAKQGDRGKAKTESPAWSCAAKKGEKGWTAQFAIQIPDAVLDGSRICRIQFARSRKHKGGFEENSAWSRTKGEFFRDVNCFGKIALARTALSAKAEYLMNPPVPKMSDGVVVPAPQSMSLSSSYVSWGNPLAIQVGEGCEKAFRVAKHVFDKQFGFGCEQAKSGQIRLELVKNLDLPSGLKEWQQREAYRLQFKGNACVVQALTERGLTCGLLTLRQLCVPRDGGLNVRKAKVVDWPEMEMRGWHVTGPATEMDFEAAKKMIDVFAALKYNWISIQFDNRFAYERNPNLSMARASTKAQHRELGELIDLYGMDVVPMTQCMSHFNYFLGKPEYRHLAEVQNPPENARHKYWNYCPRHPEIHKLVFDMIEEHLECYPKAKWYHVGLDEITFEPIGVCDRCKGATGGELVAEEINRLHKFVTSKGRRMAMWGDQLLVEHNGGGRFKTAEALPKVPRDIVIFDWHYGAYAKYPSVEFFQKEGFDVIASGWFNVVNVDRFSTVAFDQNALGYGGTTWYNLINVYKSNQLMSAIVLAADRIWKRRETSLDEVKIDLLEVFRRLHNGERQPEPVKYRAISLAPWANMSLKGGGPYGWMGLPESEDASALLSSWPSSFAGVPFKAPEGEKHAIALATRDEKDGLFEDSAWQIPIGGRVKALSFLQTCSIPETFTSFIYDQKGVNPSVLGYYVIYFEDGSSSRVSLSWNTTVTHWNSQLGVPLGKTGWLGRTKSGARLQLDVITWPNPKPELAVVTLDFISQFDKARPVLLGVTAVE
ncbi:MAG: family 20 glycosylhydrolase [Lentisphaerae bacterium]|jgi:hypothetical protein|nr:family 20 glycosylhydrolase [Lentisphaerota bacterium]